MRNYLQRIDKEKRRDWKGFYARSTHPEHEIKNYLIDNIHKICPGFKYLVDFEWEIEEGHPNKGKGDLIFGSDYKTYLTIETKSLHTGSGKTAQVSRHNARRRVKEQAERYNEFATKRFGVEVVDVIGATFTNEDYRIHFLDDNDKRIARSVAKELFPLPVLTTQSTKIREREQQSQLKILGENNLNH
ncbi:13897_t:CDS:2 [Entrophospora sp. SA101]|nr:6872_t:CDS:2 [Entrophospora sp. SA101]CAJ0651671.1 13897_t:CDS:2 [Entrophospora sp. SA101]CAJ0842359.1 11545_t:CDS:2 [Entrophospora sp. SA101]